MHGVSGAELASSVAKGGGIGFLGSGFAKDKVSLHREYNRALEMGGNHGHERIGIGLVGFTGDWLVEMAIALSPPAIWITFGDYNEPIRKIKEAGIPIMVMVQSVEEAVTAAELGASAVVAQGSESGGHGAAPISTLCFVPEVVDALKAKGFDEVAILAAGGIADGRQVAAVFALGAAGAVMGTRFAATKESMYSDEKKQRYLAAKAADTHRTRLYDDLGAVPWPAGIDGRVIGNTFSKSHGTVAPAEEEKQKALKEKLAKGQQEGDLDVAPVWSGAGVGQIHSIDSAEEVVKSVWDAACARMLEISGKNVPFRMLHPGGGLRL
ncbi:g12286 [Coccomyxa viridis]|uniref:G12286 protein n=1 Tax=Coccomyxa viridis TaxID=1274662 RepID=A0ABP1GE89_9CHLO